MQEFKGVEGALNLDATFLTVTKEVIPTRLPQVPPEICPHCKVQLYDAAPLTMRIGLLRQLEAYSSPRPAGPPLDRDTKTSTRELCRKILLAPDPLTLEDAESLKLKEAVLANGVGYHDFVQELLEDFVESAAKVKEQTKGGEETAEAAA